RLDVRPQREPVLVAVGLHARDVPLDRIEIGDKYGSLELRDRHRVEAYGLPDAPRGHALHMKDEDELLEDARRSRNETEELREESGHELDPPPKLPKGPAGEPWAKTSSGDAEHVTDDDA